MHILFFPDAVLNCSESFYRHYSVKREVFPYGQVAPLSKDASSFIHKKWQWSLKSYGGRSEAQSQAGRGRDATTAV